MGKRTLMAIALALMLGIGGVVATRTVATAHPVVNQVSGQSTGLPPSSVSKVPKVEATEQPGDQANDPDATAACATDATGQQTGDCQNSQNSSGPEDKGAGGSSQQP